MNIAEQDERSGNRLSINDAARGVWMTLVRIYSFINGTVVRWHDQPVANQLQHAMMMQSFIFLADASILQRMQTTPLLSAGQQKGLAFLCRLVLTPRVFQVSALQRTRHILGPSYQKMESGKRCSSGQNGHGRCSTWVPSFTLDEGARFSPVDEHNNYMQRGGGATYSLSGVRLLTVSTIAAPFLSSSLCDAATTLLATIEKGMIKGTSGYFTHCTSLAMDIQLGLRWFKRFACKYFFVLSFLENSFLYSVFSAR